MTKKRQSLNSMTVDELRGVYLREVGRPTSAVNKNYLISKIGLARKGRITKGPLPPRKRRDARGHSTINLRLSSDQIEALDEAVAEHGGERMSQQLAIGMGGMALGEAVKNKPEETSPIGTLKIAWIAYSVTTHLAPRLANKSKQH